MVSLADHELAPDVVWVGSLPRVSAPPQLNPELHQILIVHDRLVHEIRDYPDRAAAQAAFEAMQW